jgi:hypothetical protein
VVDQLALPNRVALSGGSRRLVRSLLCQRGRMVAGMAQSVAALGPAGAVNYPAARTDSALSPAP